jgi:hypothetical protein
MTHGREKSDSVIVAGKPTNKAERSAAELAERRAGTEGNANQLSTRWTQRRISVTQDVGSHTANYCRHTPKVGASCGNSARAVLCGGRPVTAVPTAYITWIVRDCRVLTHSGHANFKGTCSTSEDYGMVVLDSDRG